LIFVIDVIRATFARSRRPPVRVADRRPGLGPSCRRSPFFPTIQCWAGGHGFPPITDIEVALVAAPEASAASRRLAELWPTFVPRSIPGVAA
jgi:hypothetical protein